MVRPRAVTACRCSAAIRDIRSGRGRGRGTRLAAGRLPRASRPPFLQRPSWRYPGDGSIHGQSERFNDQSVTRLEVGVEAAMRSASSGRRHSSRRAPQREIRERPSRRSSECNRTRSCSRVEKRSLVPRGGLSLKLCNRSKINYLTPPQMFALYQANVPVSTVR
jgi:hypothetical protein